MTRRRRVVTLGIVTLSFVSGGLNIPVDAGERQVFEVRTHTVDGGGGTSADGIEFEVKGTIGQPDVSSSTDGEWVVNGGFWTPADPTAGAIFADGFEIGTADRWTDSNGDLPLFTPIGF